MSTSDEMGEVAILAIESAFSDVEYLGFEYSLADWDFEDSWRQMPNECECEFLDEMHAGVVAAAAAAGHVFRGRWGQAYIDDDKTKNAIEYQIRNKTILEKRESWKSLDARYLAQYSSGFFTLESKAFLHYLAAWMNLYINKKAVPYSEGMISRCFFGWLVERGADARSDPWFLALDKDKKAAIVKFLLYASSADHDPKGAKLAEEALASGRFS